jgi:hypothetical protein
MTVARHRLAAPLPRSTTAPTGSRAPGAHRAPGRTPLRRFLPTPGSGKHRAPKRPPPGGNALIAAAVGVVLVVGLVVTVRVVGADDTGPGDNTLGGERTAEEGRVLWEGGFDVGGVPEGVNGPSCGTDAAEAPERGADQYSSVEQMGNTACTNQVSLTDERTRTADSARSLRVTIADNQQREQLVSKLSWAPDGKGTVDQWYGFSLYYDSDWALGGGLAEEVSSSEWHNPVAWRTEGDNGSLNLSGDMNLDNGNGEPYEEFSEPHMVLRRNTVKDQEGFYDDGKGLDKLDLGPIVVGEWMDFVCHIRWSTTSTNALRECWRDGEYMGKRTTLNAVDTNSHTFRIGQYQTTSIDHPRTTYIDNVRIGTSYAAVDPSRDR